MIIEADDFMSDERRAGMDEVISRLSKIENRLSRIEGGLILAAFVVGAVVVPVVIVIVDHLR